MDEAIYSVMTGLLTIIGTSIAVSNYLNDRFSRLTSTMSNLITEQAVDSAQLKEKLELIEYRINANTELINHRTTRFEQLIKNDEQLNKERIEAVRMMATQSQEILLTKITSIDKSTKEVQGFLAKKADFQIRIE